MIFGFTRQQALLIMLLFLLGLADSALSNDTDYDIIIRQGLVVDGSGQPGRLADL